MAKRYDPIMCMLVDEPTKAQDAGFVLRHKNGQYMSSAGRTNEKAKAKVFSSKREAEAYKGDYVVSSTDPDYHNWSVVAVDSASALDKAIKTCDGMFASAFGEYSKGAKFKKDKFLKELSGISDAKEFAKRMQTLDNELRKNLERLDEAYNVAGKDYYAVRNEIRSIMDAFSSEAFNLYRKLDTK